MLELTCETTDMKVTEHRSGIGTSLFYAIGGAVGAELCRLRLRDYWAGYLSTLWGHNLVQGVRDQGQGRRSRPAGDALTLTEDGLYCPVPQSLCAQTGSVQEGTYGDSHCRRRISLVIAGLTGVGDPNTQVFASDREQSQSSVAGLRPQPLPHKSLEGSRAYSVRFLHRAHP